MPDSALNPKYSEALAKLVSRSPFFSLLSMEICELGWGGCRLEIRLEEKHLQPFGMVHGGVFASLVDAAAFWAIYPQLPEGRELTTVEMKLNFLAPAREGQLVAEGRCIKLGRTLALGEARVADGGGRLLAHGTATMMVVSGLDIGGAQNLPPKWLERK